jgi:hypothetical protein
MEPGQNKEHAMPDAEIEPKTPNQDALVADIERTRADLAKTIDAISDRLSPANAARRTAGRVRERVAEIDPVVAGAAALAVVGGATVLLLLRRRKH